MMMIFKWAPMMMKMNQKPTVLVEVILECIIIITFNAFSFSRIISGCSLRELLQLEASPRLLQSVEEALRMRKELPRQDWQYARLQQT